ncbi:MAG TPA: stage IV sporulation protein A, partial [Tenericutes bacterium]|nr:stage IV sporulation protein A [Mycoplasmatota bacterium]
VGYVIPNAKGYEDENGPRMVRTPWYDEEIPFIEAAELGTEKVIRDHSTIGVVVTTDGSICDLSRSDYVEAERRVIEELKEIGKPFIVVLNSSHPMLPETERIAENLRAEHNVPVLPMNLENMSENDVYSILREALYEFPVLEVAVNMPSWIATLNPDHWLKKIYMDKIRESVVEINKIRDVDTITKHFADCEYIKKAILSEVDTSTGIVTISLYAPDYLFKEVLNDIIKVDVKSKADLLKLFQDFNEAKEEYDQIKDALNMVRQTGYGVTSPTLKNMTLEPPEIVKQGSRYGVKIKAVAPSIHMIRVDVESTFEPIIGSEIQSKELINYIMKDYEKDPNSIWDSEIFGRSLNVVIKEGIQAKLALMPENARYKIRETLQKIVNKGSGGLIAIIL